MEATKVILPSCALSPLPNNSSVSAVPIPVRSTSSCPWGNTSAPESVSLNDVMSEQLAISLQNQDEEIKTANAAVVLDDLSGCGEEVTDCSDDFLLAQMLQLEFDKEHDDVLRLKESKYNGDSKVTVSYDKYLRLPVGSFSEDEDGCDEILEQNAKRHWKNIEQAEKTFQAIGKSGVSRQGNIVTTKHDLTVSGRRNAGKMLKFPPGILTGDSGMFDMKLSNNVFNSLRLYSKAEDRRKYKVHDKEEKSTAEKALDERTQLILYKLVNNQTLESLTGCVSTGKEACVYHAWSGLPEGESEFAIKVFKTTLNEFQNRDQYIRGDHRFRHRLGKQNPRKIIPMWAEKEMRNLLRMKEGGIRCPEVVALKKHVLVMSFIGREMLPAPKLKDVRLPLADMILLYEQAVQIVKDLYQKCRLVHADLSEFNLLWHQDQLWVIDVSQAVDTTHPQALHFLARDCTTLLQFFEKQGVLVHHDLYKEVCGQDLP